MKNKYPFIKCLHPKQIVNPYTREPLLVPCGCCEVCQLQKASCNSLKLKLECKAHRFNEFVTLTYDDIYVPKAQVIPLKKTVVSEYLPLLLDYDEQFIYSSTLDNIGDHYNYALIDVSGRFDTDGVLLGTAYMRDIDWFSLRKKVGYGDTINVLRYEDIQLFLKRLRERIFRLYGQKIRYYCTGEYGPKHYRPHWHLILSYDCEFLAQGIGEIIRSCWKYGRVDYSKSRGKCAQYTAGYVNGTCDLPALYRGSQCKPKSYHSVRLGEALFKIDLQEIFKTSDFSFVKNGMCLDNVYTEFNLWRSFTSRIFPRCKQYAIRSIEQRLEAYRLEVSVCKSFGSECNVIDVAKKIYSYIIRFGYGYHNLTPRLHYDKDLYHLVEYFMRSNGLTFDNFYIHRVNTFNNTIPLLRSIYKELLCSRYFIRHICNSHDYSVSVRKLEVIDNYYKFIEYENLKSQLQWQSDNLTEESTFDDYKYQYSDIYFDINEYQDNTTFKAMRESQLKNYNNSNKYKKLNDNMNVRRDN